MTPEYNHRDVKIAVRPGGVVERTPVLRNLFYAETPPHALLRANLTSKAAALIARDIDALDDSAAHAFFYASRRDDLATRAMEVMISRGLWLGVPVGADRFGALKNREFAIVVGKEGAADRVFRQRPIETFDLTEDEPPIDL